VNKDRGSEGVFRMTGYAFAVIKLIEKTLKSLYKVQRDHYQ